MKQKNTIYGQNDGFLHRNPRRVYSPGYKQDLKINIISVLFALEETVGLSQGKIRNE
jgi:hypothetical protein